MVEAVAVCVGAEVVELGGADAVEQGGAQSEAEELVEAAELGEAEELEGEELGQ